MKAPKTLFTVLAVCALAPAAFAQSTSFVVGNFTLEDVTTAQDQALASSASAAANGAGFGFGIGSSNLIQQQGFDNSAATLTVNSPDSANIALQAGSSNEAVGVISDSPGSVIAQLQLGAENTSAVGILGGADNAVATVQVGTGHTAGVILENSVGTTVVYPQIELSQNDQTFGSAQVGSYRILNAPRGTVIRVGGEGE